MLKIFVKLQSLKTSNRFLKVTDTSLTYLYFFILKKNTSDFKFRKVFKSKRLTLINSPFHYKNSKKNIKSPYSFITINFNIPARTFRKSLFFLKGKIQISPLLMKITKVKLKFLYVKILFFF